MCEGEPLQGAERTRLSVPAPAPRDHTETLPRVVREKKTTEIVELT